MGDDAAAQRTDIEATVRQVRRHWQRVSVPRQTRRRRAEELRDHLEAVTERGGSIRDVVGDDPVAFAAEWAQADRGRPLVGVMLQFVAALLLAWGMVALLGPWGFGADTTGFAVRNVGFVTLVLAGAYTIQVVRTLRSRLTASNLLLLGALFPALMGLGGGVLTALGDPDAFILVPWTGAGALLALGSLVGAGETWLRRTARL